VSYVEGVIDTVTESSATSREQSLPGRWLPGRWLPGRSVRWRSVPWTAVGAFVASRLVVAVAGLIAHQLTPRGPLSQRWDGFWFTYIAQHGYPRTLITPGFRGPYGRFSEWAFLPGYPLLVRAASAVTRLPVGFTSLAVNAVLGLAASVLLWRLFAEVAGPETADRASILFWFFPGSVVLSMAYSEALFLVTASVALLALIRRQWWLAGIAAAVAGGTRATGIALVAAAIVAAWPALRRREWRALAAPLLAPLGLVAFIVYGGIRTGDYLVWHRAERLWNQHFDFSAALPGRLVRAFQVGSQTGSAEALVVACSVLLVGAAVLFARGERLPRVLGAYLAVTLFLSLADSFVGPRPRFVLMMLPLFLVAGRALRGTAYQIVLVVVGSLLPVATIVYLGAVHGAP
jgi:hypothetical protein